MILHCKLCGAAIKSIGPFKETESAHTLELMAIHLKSRHAKHAESLAQEIQLAFLLLNSYLLLHKYASIPPEEKELLACYQEAEQALLNLFAGEPQAAS